MRPLDQVVGEDDGRRLVQEDEGAVRQVGPWPFVNAPAVGSAEEALAVQLPVDLLGRRRVDAEAFGLGRAVGVVARPAVLGTRSMTRGEGDGFVVEEQKR